MQIEHSVTIHSSLERVWNVFTDISCWNDWNTVASEVLSESERLAEGKHFEFCIRPFVIPLNIKPVVEKVVPGKHVIWSGSKYGISARHEFLFEPLEEGVNVRSRELFHGKGLTSLLIRFSYRSLNRLSVLMLHQLKEASEDSRVFQKPEREHHEKQN